MRLVAIDVAEQFMNLQYNVAIIGWLGEIVSCVTLMSSALMLHCRSQLIETVLVLWQRGEGESVDDVMRYCVTNVVVTGGIMGYVLSLSNLLVSSLLLVGVARSSCGLLIPWMLYHGILFATSVNIAMYMIILSLCVDFVIFSIALMIFTMAIIICFKIYHEVYLLFKILSTERTSAIPAQDVDCPTLPTVDLSASPPLYPKQFVFMRCENEIDV